MSYSLQNEKFTIFGNGYDTSRNDSGFGATTKFLEMKVYSAAIDSSGSYVWFVTDDGLKKYSTRTWTEVEQSTIPVGASQIVHPSNVSNNYGLVMVPNTDTLMDAYIFDLTDDSLIATIPMTISVEGNLIDWDSILANDKIYIVNRHYGSNASDRLLVFDIVNRTFDNSTVFGNVGCNGFINTSLVYAVYTREWFYQTSTAYGVNFSGVAAWQNPSIDRNDYIHPWGFTGNGKLYFPVLIDGEWHYGEFDGTTSPTFSPVSPIRTFGSFDTAPNLAPYISENERNIYIVYNEGRTKACALTSLGVLLTDFNNVNILSNITMAPVAMNDRMVICSDYRNNNLYIIGI